MYEDYDEKIIKSHSEHISELELIFEEKIRKRKEKEYLMLTN
jgi:hypothetical protein